MSSDVLALSDSDASLERHLEIVENELGIRLRKFADSTDTVFQSPFGSRSFLTLYGDSDLEDDGEIEFSKFPVVVSIDTGDIDEAADAAQRIARRMANDLECETVVVIDFGKPLVHFDGKRE